MTLKGKMVLSIALASVFTAGFFVLLAFAFINDFSTIMTLSLLLAMMASIFMWAFFYLSYTKYKDSLNPNKKKYIKRGNRAASRKKMR